MQYNNLSIIGTSHISKHSVEEVKDHILTKNPDIIAIELDRSRAHALLSKKKKIKLKDIKKIGVTGIIFGLIAGYIEKKLGKLVKTKPGSEMLIAIKLAKKENIPILLMDQDIRITLKKISKGMPLKEKLKFLKDLIFSKTNQKELEKIDISKVPTDKIIEEMTKEFKKRYPTLYKILITERNEIMAKNLNNLIINNKDKKILAIMGAGHKKEIEKILKNGNI
ncbi:conjugal transfer protein TraB [Candidatus Woesearchaeota archaeon]|jgi:pheromone shutdown-related protein TraB|nr:conjugal transfer protein TraB [Candidatus Woesearchaeota archaeon]MBT4835266.1 conjugal transfer protein TraB [Candidatus Woesearchaeota archaeon]MBT6734743.1 conjugal transfer protein TraB [Candidatus Woesearchaeota archaeon]MBT7169944.1 conjugal transfer protein TraB [Candidatus Woesearchaeota archaeon]MBT7474332.1 conjugal transfer protein TraB [Candidatus Woesearchaeota archaeon]